MKLAEALQIRADLNKRIRQLERRLENNATVQEGEAPAEEPIVLLTELNRCIAELEQLISRINLTNCITKLDELTLTEMIAKKDCLTIKINVYREFLESASQLPFRAARTEIKIKSTVSVKELQKEFDEFSKALRILDNKIQELNWKTELL